jgi:GT2 family glycosyltransferase
VSVVVPVRNEGHTVEATLDSLARQDLGAEHIEVLVYDGMSTDRTRAICEAFAGRAPWARFEVHSNPEQTVPHALNAGLARARGTWFTRLDGRTAFSASYLRTCLEALDAAPPLTAVGGRLEAIANTPTSEAIAAVVTHPWGVGTGFRVAVNDVVAVPHHPFAVWRTAVVREIGGFDTGLVRNQDDEFSMRGAKHGAEILLVPDISVTYRPRARLRGLAAQYFQYGLWKAAVGRRAGLFPIRSAVPPLVVLGAVGAVGHAIVRRESRLLMALAAAYGSAGIRISTSRAEARPVRTTAALATLHLAYGIGILTGVAHPGLTDSRLGRMRIR